jgi:hypothetical protein
MAGLEQSRRFLGAEVRRWRAVVEAASLNVDPYGLMSDRRPAPGIPRLVGRNGDDTLFHSGYVWLGNAPRLFSVELEAWKVDRTAAELELRVHRHPALAPDDVACAMRTRLVVRDRARSRVCLQLPTEEGYSYAVLGKVIAGACWVAHASIQVRPAGAMAEVKGSTMYS